MDLSLWRAPGVYAAQRDTWLLADVLSGELADSPRPRRVLELGVGTGALSVVAAGFPDTDVTGVDLSRRALLSAWMNARRHGRRVRVRRGDLCTPVAGRRFDVVVTNPPYVPSADPQLPRRGPGRAVDGGPDGRTVLDRVCSDAPRLLLPGGCLLMVHSAVGGLAQSTDRLAAQGLEVDVAARCSEPFGPVMNRRAALLEQRGLIVAGERTEELVVVRARRPEPAPPVASVPCQDRPVRGICTNG